MTRLLASCRCMRLAGRELILNDEPPQHVRDTSPMQEQRGTVGGKKRGDIQMWAPRLFLPRAERGHRACCPPQRVTRPPPGASRIGARVAPPAPRRARPCLRGGSPQAWPWRTGQWLAMVGKGSRGVAVIARKWAGGWGGGEGVAAAHDKTLANVTWQCNGRRRKQARANGGRHWPLSQHRAGRAVSTDPPAGPVGIGRRCAAGMLSALSPGPQPAPRPRPWPEPVAPTAHG